MMLCLLAPLAWAEGVTHAGPTNVPELLVTAAGEKVTTCAQWEQVRRPDMRSTITWSSTSMERAQSTSMPIFSMASAWGMVRGTPSRM